MKLPSIMAPEPYPPLGDGPRHVVTLGHVKRELALAQAAAAAAAARPTDKALALKAMDVKGVVEVMGDLVGFGAAIDAAIKVLRGVDM